VLAQEGERDKTGEQGDDVLMRVADSPAANMPNSWPNA
jgi:hypothetical protein